jgi:hypothetical protein
MVGVPRHQHASPHHARLRSPAHRANNPPMPRANRRGIRHDPLHRQLPPQASLPHSGPKPTLCLQPRHPCPTGTRSRSAGPNKQVPQWHRLRQALRQCSKADKRHARPGQGPIPDKAAR